MVCDRTVFRSAVQNLFFVGYMVGSIFFGIMADKWVFKRDKSTFLVFSL
jgi:MFS family permease